LGQLIEGFYRLSEEDRKIFLVATNLATGDQVIGHPGPAQPGPSRTVRIENPRNADGSRKTLTSGEQPPEGFTKNPKTGEVFKKSAPKPRSAEFIRLSDALSSVKKEMFNFRNSGVTIGEDNNVTGTTSHLALPAAQQEWRRLWRHRTLCQECLDAYKRTHPEEFSPPKGYDPEKGRHERGPRPPTPVDPATDPRYAEKSASSAGQPVQGVAKTTPKIVPPQVQAGRKANPGASSSSSTSEKW